MLDEFEIIKMIKRTLCRAGQNPRRIKTNIHQWGIQIDVAVVSNSGNPQLAINIVKTHQSTNKHTRILQEHDVKEFEVPKASKPKVMLALKEIEAYVSSRRRNHFLLKSTSNKPVMTSLEVFTT